MLLRGPLSLWGPPITTFLWGPRENSSKSTFSYRTPVQCRCKGGLQQAGSGSGLLTTAVNIFETARNRWENREISRSDDCTMNSFGA